MPRTFLPTIRNQSPQIVSATDYSKTQAILKLMREHGGQRRSVLLWDDTLAEVAQEKCERQAHEGWDGHTDPQGYGPNHWVREAGYALPDYYPDGDGNTVESLANNGSGGVPEVWSAWMTSAGHRRHILGIDGTYKEQTHVGIGYYYLPTSKRRYYWAVVTCPPRA